jgi:GAF domain-containing protein
MPEMTELMPAAQLDGVDPSTRIAQLEGEVAELRRERDHLVATVEILQVAADSTNFVEILQAVTRKLGDTFGLDRCSVFLMGEAEEVRVVASYEDSSVRNLLVDVRRYPELQRALESGETVFIPDALREPMLEPVRHMMDLRKVRSIIVVPIRWRGMVIGAIFVRTERDGSAFSEADVRFCQAVAALTARALHNAHRLEAALASTESAGRVRGERELQGVALIAFLRRLLDRFTQTGDRTWSESLLPATSDEELQRLVTVAMKVIEEESRT